MPSQNVRPHKCPPGKSQAEAGRRFISDIAMERKPSFKSKLCFKFFSKDFCKNRLQFSFDHRLKLRPGVVPTIQRDIRCFDDAYDTDDDDDYRYDAQIMP